MESSIETSLSTALPSSELSICFVDNENAEAMVSSREVAAKFGKRHDNVMQAIEKELSISISALQKKIENIDEKKIELLKKQKMEIISQQNDNENNIPKKDIWNFITQQ